MDFTAVKRASVSEMSAAHILGTVEDEQGGFELWEIER